MCDAMMHVRDAPLQIVAEKKSSTPRLQRTEKVNQARHKADLDRLKFKVKHIMQLLKEEQKHQEGTINNKYIGIVVVLCIALFL